MWTSCEQAPIALRNQLALTINDWSQVASNRYAPHLERCMGLNGNGSRRSAVSRTATKTKFAPCLFNVYDVC